jgi:hypothetical protein
MCIGLNPYSDVNDLALSANFDIYAWWNQDITGVYTEMQLARWSLFILYLWPGSPF